MLLAEESSPNEKLEDSGKLSPDGTSSATSSVSRQMLWQWVFFI